MGTIIGIILFCASFPVLWYNEKRGVRMAKIIDEGLKECVEVNNGKCIQETEGALICLHGEILSDETIEDDFIGVKLENGIKLMRKVEIFQYCEEKVDDDEHSYKKNWTGEIVDSSSFGNETHRGKNERKSNKFVWNKIFYSNEIRIGDYGLNESLKELIKCDENMPLFSQENCIKFDEIKNKTSKTPQINENMVYISKPEFAKPRLGDLRISYDYLKSPRSFTIIARQMGNILEPYYGKNVEAPKVSYELDNKQPENQNLNTNLIEKKEEKSKENVKKKGIVSTIRDFMDDSIKINWLFEGTIPLDVCFTTKMKQEEKITWILRLVGFLMMTFGVFLFFAPLLALLNWIPILGTLISIIFFIFSLSVGLSLSLLTISIAWFFYRPIVGIFMISFSVLLYIITVVLI